jgi:hypothetical protein
MILGAENPAGENAETGDEFPPSFRLELDRPKVGVLYKAKVANYTQQRTVLEIRGYTKI